MIRIALRDLSARALRSALTAFGIAIAVGTFVAVDGTVKAFERALVNNVAAVETHLEVTEKGSLDFLSSLIPENVADKVRHLQGVGAASPMLIRLVSIIPGFSVPVVGWPDNAYLWSTISVVEGRKPQLAEHREAMLGVAVAKRLNARSGKEIRLMGDVVTVVGIADSASQINRSSIFLLLPDLQAITFRDHQVTSIGVQLTPEGLSTLPKVKAAMEEVLPDFSVIDTDNLSHDNFLMNLTKSFSSAMSVIAVALALFGVMNTVWTSVRERRYEFAVMRAFGWSLPRIALFILCQSVAIAMAGFSGGVILGHFGAISVAYLGPVSAFLEPEFEWGIIVWAIIICLFVSVAATLLPIYSVARADPALTLRSI